MKHPLLMLIAGIAITAVSYEATKASSRAYLNKSASIKTEFKRKAVCPSTGEYSQKCPGYWIDFIIPKKCDGPLAISNMQWLSIEDHKRKTKYEIRGDANHKPCMGYVK